MKIFILCVVIAAVTAKATEDRSVVMRNQMMTMMQEQSDLFTKCMSEGTCPQFDNKKIDGPAACIGGVAVTPTATYDCNNVDMMSFVPTAELFPDSTVSGGKETNDIWGWEDPVDGEHYALVGMNDGTSFVRVTNGEAPVVLGHLKTAAGSGTSTWRDIKVFGDHAFVVSEHANHGMQVFDLNQLRGLAGGVERRFIETAYYAGTSTHNIVGSNEGFMYLVGTRDCAGGLLVVNVQTPGNPTFAGCFANDGYVHDAECLMYTGPDVEHQGKEICFCYNEDTLTIVDVADKTNMRMLSRSPYAAYYTHQGWLTEDQTLVLLDDELDEMNGPDDRTHTYLWDVSDLDNPVLANTFINALPSIDHNQYIHGQYTYQSNYQTGLRILQIDQATPTLVEVASFDNYPDDNRAQFNGAWSLYRFSDGKVAITSSEYGFYMLMPVYANFP